MKTSRLGRFCWTALLRIYPYLAYAGSLLRRRHQAVHVWPEGPVALGENVAVFIHFDKHGQVAEHVLTYIRALRDNGFSVAFVSNSGRQRPDCLAALQRLCCAVVVRRNIGYDFGAIREMLERLGLPRKETQRLLIANDSVYGPLAPIESMLARADFEEADIWGATESWQHRYHLQSYFLMVGPRVLRSQAWIKFWQNVRPMTSKQWVVMRYEIGLTQKLLKAGFRCKPLWSYHELAAQVLNTPIEEVTGAAAHDPVHQMRVLASARLRKAITHRAPLNPTADLWRQLLLSGFPFLKVELLKKNPTGVPDVADWRTVAGAISGVDLEMIEEDLKQKIRNRTP